MNAPAVALAETLLILPLTKHGPWFFPRYRTCYLQDLEHPTQDNEFLTVETDMGGPFSQEYQPFIDLITQLTQPVKVYQLPDSSRVSFVYNTPPEFMPDILLIQQGKISETSQAYQDLCRSILGTEIQYQLIYDEIFKVPEV